MLPEAFGHVAAPTTLVDVLGRLAELRAIIQYLWASVRHFL